MFLWYGIRGTVDRKLSANLDRLKATGYPFELKVFTGLGHGGLAGEHPAQFVEEVTAAYQKSLSETDLASETDYPVFVPFMGS